MTLLSIKIGKLRPTQAAVGMRLVKWKRQGLRRLDRKPQELVDFILENPIRVVLGPGDTAYIIDHHHLGLALSKEGFKTAPVLVEADLSADPDAKFWATMEKRTWVHAFDGAGRPCPLWAIPARIEDLEDDPYRGLAGFVRYHGGFAKSQIPYAEFQWAGYFRGMIRPKQLAKNFDKAVEQAVALAHAPEARALPGYTAKPASASSDGD
jgi:hypothetical protein